MFGAKRNTLYMDRIKLNIPYNIQKKWQKIATLLKWENEVVTSQVSCLIKLNIPYFVVVDNTPFELENHVAFSEYLVNEVGVVAIPTSVFYLNPEEGKNLVRFTFCKDEETIRSAVDRVKMKLRSTIMINVVYEIRLLAGEHHLLQYIHNPLALTIKWNQLTG